MNLFSYSLPYPYIDEEVEKMEDTTHFVMVSLINMLIVIEYTLSIFGSIIFGDVSVNTEQIIQLQSFKHLANHTSIITMRYALK